MAELSNHVPAVSAQASPMNNNASPKIPAVFAVIAESEGQIGEIIILAESLRKFGGKFKDAPIWMYCPQSLPDINPDISTRLKELGIEIRESLTPEDASDFYYSGKVFAAAKAESEALDKAAILIWLDSDTIILDEPGEFLLPEDINYGWRPVMHKLIGSLYSETPDAFWTLAFKLLAVPDSAMFPMETFTDHLIIRPYFNCGVMPVRPEAGIFRKWAEYYPILYRSPEIIAMAEKDKYVRIFLHQVALTCAVLNTINESEMIRLSDRINYPLFFKAMFGAEKEYNDLNGVITMRYEYFLRNPIPNWKETLKGPKDRLEWFKAIMERN